jgi:hypothetical protein
VFSHLEVCLSGHHLPLRFSGSFSFRLSFAPWFCQLEPWFNGRLGKPCTNNQACLHLQHCRQDYASPPSKSKSSKAQEWMANVALNCASQKQNQMVAKSIADRKSESTFSGESFGKNDTHRR